MDGVIERQATTPAIDLDHSGNVPALQRAALAWNSTVPAGMAPLPYRILIRRAPDKKALRRGRHDVHTTSELPPMIKSHLAFSSAASMALAMFAAASPAQAATPSDLLAAYATHSTRAPDAEQGRSFFTTPHGRDWACASCHGPRPVVEGRHAATGKPIQPLAPGANAVRFTDADKVEKWFRRNCGDVVGRACTDAEKADVLAWLITLKP